MITNITDKERELQAKLKQYEAVMQQALEALKEYVNADAAPDELNPRKRQACAAITALREALKDVPESSFGNMAQPAQQETDEWTPCMKLPVVVHVRKQRPGEVHVSTREGITPVKPDDLIMRGVSGEEYPIGRNIFEQTYSMDTKSQAQQDPDLTAAYMNGLYDGRKAVERKWVGLTDQERNEIHGSTKSPYADLVLVEAKLKEKNA